MVCLFLRLHCGHAFTFFQENILVDSDGHARVAGLGAAYISSLIPGLDVDEFFEAHGSAPELVHSRRSGSGSARATKESDIHAFGVLAYEVSLIVTACYGQMTWWIYSFRYSLGKLRFSRRASSQGSVRSFAVVYRSALNTLSFPTVCGR